MLSFTLLGRVELLQDGIPLSQFRSQKEAALLIYLAQSGQSHRRDALAELLWESNSTKQSLTNLRTVLARLRKQVGDALIVSRQSLALTPEDQQQVDSVILLETLATMGQINTAAKATALQKTLDNYQGDFLADFYLSSAPQFNEWAIATREYIRQQVVTAYDKLGQYLLSVGDIENGITAARRWLQVDMLDEIAHLLLIQLYLKAGNVREAIAHYDYCAELLRQELGIHPPAKMTALIKDIRPTSPAPTPARPVATVRHNLPTPYDQFFGRKAAQEEIHVRLDQPWCRLITITGQGGVGKTRLATTIARGRLSQYPDGVWLVELANIDSEDEDLAEAIAVEIATMLDLRLTGSATPAEQLLNHLQHKQLMLVLDNFEHLLEDGVQIVLDIVQRCEYVQLLITSREALKIRAEWTIALTGLSYPTDERDEMPSDAVELFVARRAQQQHELITAAHLAAIRTICHMVEGLPLAIELAAALTRHTTSQAVADSLRDGFDTLTVSLRDIPDRHRGLHIVFEMSWRTLPPALQQRLARLAVFRGGFTPAAAQEITAADELHLAALVEKSLLRHHAGSDRYTLHPIIRAYAAEKRPTTDQTPQKHAHYYLELLAQHSEPLQKERPQDSISVLEPDIDNIRLAWQTGLAEHSADLLSAALPSLSIYYQLRGLAHEAESVMHATVKTASMWETAGHAFHALAVRAGLERARFQNRLGRYHPAMQTLKAVVKQAAPVGDRWAEGMAHVWWGESLWRLGEYDVATNKLNHALDIGQALGDSLIIGWSHHQLGIIHDIQSNYETAHDHLQQACDEWHVLDNTNTLSVSLNSIGIVCYHQGNLTAAQQVMEQALALCNQLDNRHLEGLLLNNLSTVSIEQGDYSGAQYYLQLGLKLATITGNLTGQGEIYTNLGKNYRLLGEMNLSVESLEKGLQIAESIKNRSLMATAMLSLANSKSALGDSKQAEALYSHALQIAQQDNLLSIECEILIGMAKLLGSDNRTQAKQYISQAMTLAESIQNPRLLERAKAVHQNLYVSTNINEKNLSK